MTPPALTELELEALGLTRVLGDKLFAICRQGNSADVTHQDTMEIAQLIHAIQNVILAQAGARAYPDRFRLLGSSFKVREA